MQRDEFIKILKSKNYSFEIDGKTLVVTHHGYVDFGRLRSLPEGVAFNNHGEVYLNRLTSLPEGTVFNNQDYVCLNSLTSENQFYRGKSITLRSVDGWTMLVQSTKTIGEYAVCKSRYFGGGELEKLTQCYVASCQGFSAHGNTIDAAISDVRFKVAQVNFDVDDLIDRVKQTQIIERNDFRLLTGACESGLRHGLESMGLDPDLKSMPLKDALIKVKGHYGSDKLIAAFA